MRPITLILSVLQALMLVFADVDDVVIPRGYHNKVGIPLAKKIREMEDRIFQNQSVGYRIYHGTNVLPYKHPFYGGLIVHTVVGSKHYQSVCGSSLLSPSRVVTAAHCWDDGDQQGHNLTVVLGSQHLYYGGLRIHSREVYVHPEWNTSTVMNDIAMIYLPDKLYDFTDNISPIALPEDSELSLTFEGYTATVVGMGLSETGQESLGPDTSLRETHPQIISEDKCRTFYDNTVTAGTICTWKDVMDRDTCEGDSGGPLVTYHAGRKILTGIVSYGPTKCGGNWPDGYTRVTYYMDYIRQHAPDLPRLPFNQTQSGNT